MYINIKEEKIYAWSKEIIISKVIKAKRTKVKVKVNRLEETLKKENINIMIWPEDKFVLSRIIKVNGRMMWLNTSTNGRKSIKAEGDPKGSIWAINP